MSGMRVGSDLVVPSGVEERVGGFPMRWEFSPYFRR